MKIIFATILLFVCFSFDLSAQKAPGTINDLNSVSEVNDFLHSFGEPYKYMSVNDSLHFYLQGMEHRADSLQISSFIKGDIDGNGKTDLLILAHGSNGPICILDSGDGHYGVIQIGQWLIFNQSFATLRSIGHDVCIILTTGEHPDGSRTATQFVVDTLIFKFGGFVEYNANPLKRLLKSISYKSLGYFAGRGTYISLDQKRIGTYEKYRLRDKGRIDTLQSIKTKINRKDYKEIADLVDYINPEHLTIKHKDNAMWSDLPSVTLEIELNDGAKREFSKSFLHYGINQIIQRLLNLKNTQKWKEIKGN